MQKCKSCNIQFQTSEDICPLCQNKLVGKCNKDSNIIIKNNPILLKIFLFIMIIIMFLSCSFEMYLSKKLHFSLYIIVILLAVYSLLYDTLKIKKNVIDLLGKNQIVVVVLLLFLYFYTKQIIIINYIIPIISIIFVFMNSIMFLVLKKKYVVNHFILFLYHVLLLLLLIFFTGFNVVTFYLLSFIAILFLGIYVIAVIFFCLDDGKEEFKKFFHI